MNLRFDNDRCGLAQAVATARLALLPQLQGLDADLDTIEHIRWLNAPFADPGLRSGPWHRRALKGAVSVQKNRLFWREQRAMEIAAGLWRRMALRAAGGPREARGSILFVVPYDIVDPTTGGASRLYGLAREMAATHDVNLISLVGPRREPDAIGLFPGVTLYVVPRTAAFERHVAAQTGRLGDAAALLALDGGIQHMPLLSYWIAALGRAAEMVFVDGPPLAATVRRELPDRPVIYESPNAYRKFVRLIAGEGTPQADAAAAEAARFEADMCRLARLVVCVSEEDRAFVARENGLAPDRVVVSPNGVHTPSSLFFTPAETRRLKAYAGLNVPTALFVGSSYKPNIDAVGFLAASLAPVSPGTQFVVMGMTASEFTRGSGRSLPGNLTFTGKISGTDKETLFALSDVALCPVTTGSGSSLKIPDYVAHGKPVISTPFGMRGFDALLPHVCCAEPADFPAALHRVQADEVEALGRKCRAARDIVAREYDWSRVAADLMRAVRPFLSGAR